MASMAGPVRLRWRSWRPKKMELAPNPQEKSATRGEGIKFKVQGSERPGNQGT